jgi:hypothetical protein
MSCQRSSNNLHKAHEAAVPARRTMNRLCTPQLHYTSNRVHCKRVPSCKPQQHVHNPKTLSMCKRSHAAIQGTRHSSAAVPRAFNPRDM